MKPHLDYYVRYLHCKRQINHRVKALEEERTIFSTSSNGHSTHMCYTGGTGFHQMTFWNTRFPPNLLLEKTFVLEFY